MLMQMSKRMLATTDKRILWKFAYNFGYKGMRSVQKFKQRIKRGDYFPPFLYISVINSCNLRCQGCWVKVDGPSNYLSADKMDKIINPEVVDVSLPRDRATGRPRGFGFVTFATSEEAIAARDKLDGSLQAGRAISVRPFSSEPPRRGPARRTRSRSRRPSRCALRPPAAPGWSGRRRGRRTGS